MLSLSLHLSSLYFHLFSTYTFPIPLFSPIFHLVTYPVGTIRQFSLNLGKSRVGGGWAHKHPRLCCLNNWGGCTSGVKFHIWNSSKLLICHSYFDFLLNRVVKLVIQSSTYCKYSRHFPKTLLDSWTTYSRGSSNSHCILTLYLARL